MFGYKFQRPNPSRHQLYIDNGLQAVLLRRLTLYSIAALVYFVVILAIDIWVQQPELTPIEFLWGFFDEAIYWAPGLLALIPVLAYDLLRLTNRFAGPVFSLQREMAQLAAGKDVAPISFRDEDHWHPIAESFNEIREELSRYRATGTPEERAAPDPNHPYVPPRERLFNDDEVDEDADELAALG